MKVNNGMIVTGYYITNTTKDRGLYTLDFKFIDGSLSKTYSVGRFTIRTCLEIAYYLNGDAVKVGSREAKGKKGYLGYSVPCVTVEFDGRCLQRSKLNFIDEVIFPISRDL